MEFLDALDVDGWIHIGNLVFEFGPRRITPWAAAEQAAHVGIGGVGLDPDELPQSINVIS